ncbi:hypothetical protein MDAP_001985 [Mitosporidium daphniae]
MGGLDARYLASILNVGPNSKFNIASITTLSSPHRGSMMANLWCDFLLSKRDFRFNLSQDYVSKREFLLRSLFFWVSTLMNASISSDSGAHPSFVSFSDSRSGPEFSVYKNLFHTLYHLSPDFMEHSFNQNVLNAPEIQYFSVGGDISSIDLENWPYKQYYHLVLNKEGPNDGLVSVNSAKWGKYHGTFAIKHHQFCRVKRILNLTGEALPAADIRERISMLRTICSQIKAIE